MKKRMKKRLNYPRITVRQSNGITPRLDAEALRIMAEREVIRSTKDDLNKTQIIELLQSTSIDWAFLAQAIMPAVDIALENEEREEHKKKILKERDVSHLKSFAYLDIDEE